VTSSWEKEKVAEFLITDNWFEGRVEEELGKGQVLKSR